MPCRTTNHDAIRQPSCWQPYAGINWGYVVPACTTEGFDRQFPSVEPPSMPETEADTCRKWVTPKLHEAGWSDDQIQEQHTFTDGRVIPTAKRIRRGKQKRADYRLRYTRDFPIAVVEAKAIYKTAGEGLQQAKDYAEILDLKFAYATNGKEIIEFDFLTGVERKIDAFPSPAELWSRLRQGRKLGDDKKAEQLLTPCYHQPEKRLRYYQEIAINRVVEAILKGQPRILLTMATGTGKTLVAFQICWKLWNALWNRDRRTPPPQDPLSGRPQHPRGRPEGQDLRPVWRCPLEDHRAGKSARGGRCTSPSIRPSLPMRTAQAYTASIRLTSSTSSSWTSAIGEVPGTRAVGGRSSNTSSPPISSV